MATGMTLSRLAKSSDWGQIWPGLVNKTGLAHTLYVTNTVNHCADLLSFPLPWEDF